MKLPIKKFGLYFLLGIIIVLAVKFYYIIYVFFPAIAAGCVLAYLFNPVYLAILRVIKRPSMSAFIVLFLIFVLLLIPSAIITLTVQQQVNTFFNDTTVSSVKDALNHLDDIINERLNIHISENTINLLMARVQNAITVFGPKMLYSITRFVLLAFITFFLLFYLLLNSREVINTFRDYFPISYTNCDLLLEEMGKHTRALILGQLLVATIQGTLGGIGFFVCGISGGVVWGLVMVIVAFIPFLGAGFIWLPAGIFQLLKGNYYSGIGILLWGVLIVSTIDNIIRPKLTSALGKIHPVIVLLGVFIGLKEWGFIGLVIGPLMISVLLILIRMFREEYIEE